MATLDAAQSKKLKKAAVAAHYGTIRAAEEIVTEETKKATGAIKALIEAENSPGPFLFSEKDGKGGTRKFFLTFRKSKGADSYTITRKEYNTEDDATPIADADAPG